MSVWILLVGARAVAGETATGIAVISGGRVLQLNVVSQGSGYTTEPTVLITGGGGSGAAARAILSGDRVVQLLLQSPGSGYTSAPSVLIDGPPTPLGMFVELVPKLTVSGRNGTPIRLESAGTLDGTWSPWTNALVGPDSAIVVDALPDKERRFYRAVAEPQSQGPAGFVWIPPGIALIGSPNTESGRSTDEFQYPISLSRGFWMSDHEVTQAEYQAVMGSNPSQFKGDTNRPVETVTWTEAVEYCSRLTDQERSTGRLASQHAYRLPTEAEWEYAARAGSMAPQYGPINEIAWYTANSSNQSRPVRSKQPNRWGLYDTLGNVWEWCSDWYGTYSANSGLPVMDPGGPGEGTAVVYRGGSWGSDLANLRAARRNSAGTSTRFNNVGFRPVLSGVVPPFLSRQPADQQAIAGQTIRLNVTAGGTGPLNYQWQRNGANISSATAATLTIGNVQAGNEGDYRVIIGNAAGTIISTPVRLSVTLPPTISGAPKPLVVSTGQVAQFTVNPTGTPPLSYQWQVNGTNIPGATTSSLVLTNVGLTTAGDYRIVITNAAGNTTSSPARLTVGDFVWIPPGTFVMGSPASDSERFSNEPQYTVTLTRGFWLCNHEVTQAEYQAVLTNNPSYFQGDTRLPVEQVSWNDAMAYCRRLTDRERAAGRIAAWQAFRLPTEAEWEFAARAGTTGSRYGSLKDIAWYAENSGGQTWTGMRKSPNPWGLYDMLGNVWEWCSDWYLDINLGNVTDPAGPALGEYKVVKGGGLNGWTADLRAPRRDWWEVPRSMKYVGFRVALSDIR